MSTETIDLRSDTVTRPTMAMRKAMYEAEVGDDVNREDPTVNELEHDAAERVGKEASLLVPSGTFGNQLALFTHCQRGDEVILDETCHIVQHEAGAAAIIAGVQLRTIVPAGRLPCWDDIEPRLRMEEDIHYPRTSLIELENAHSNGEVLSLESGRLIGSRARERGIPLHLDGARLFNAAAYLEAPAALLADQADSVMFCLSKGLCAPVGSILAGSRDFIERARKRRKIMGGGMRQAGVLAAAGLVSLREMVDRLGEDHEKADLLARALGRLELFEIQPRPVKINMFFVRFKPGPYAGLEGRLVEVMSRHRILTYPPEQGWIRFVTHHDVSFSDLERVGNLIPKMVEELKRGADRAEDHA